jgi:hypothetical protein
VLLWCLFRFCAPVRNWWTSRQQKHFDEKAKRLGTSPEPWKWPLQFIFGHDRPAPPRRPPQYAQPRYSQGTFSTSHPAYARDLESNSSGNRTTNVEGTFQPPRYKSYATVSGTSWVADGWRAPLSHISQRLSNWPRRSGPSRWFFGGGASRWSESDNGDATAYNPNQASVDMYGAGPRAQRSSLSKSPVVEVSHVEIALTPPQPTYPHQKRTSIPSNNPSLALSPFGANGAIRPRASPRSSFPRNSALTATTTAPNTPLPPLPPPPIPYGNFTSHFSASTADPATPRRFISEGLPLPTFTTPRLDGRGDVPALPTPVAKHGTDSAFWLGGTLTREERAAAARERGERDSLASLSSVSSVGSLGSVKSSGSRRGRAAPFPVRTSSVAAGAAKLKIKKGEGDSVV